MNGGLSNLNVQGDPNAVDSFAACVCAVAEYFGRPAGYEFVEALTGTCFSPCHNQGEECIGWMMDGGNAYRAEFLAEALGLSVEKIELETSASEDWLETYKLEGALPRQVEAYFGKLKQAQDSGGVAVLATWPAWSVLTGWADDLNRLPFATTPGFEQVVGSIWPPIRTRLAIVFRLDGDPLSRQAVLKSALRFGAQVASGQVSPRLPGFDAENAYGGAMYDVILERAGQETLCPGCQEDGCFGRTAKRLHDGHHASVVFLQEAARLLEEGSLPTLLDGLQRHYAAMQAVSSRYLDWNERRDSWNSAEVRGQIRTDFEQMKTLHQQAVHQFQGLLEAL